MSYLYWFFFDQAVVAVVEISAFPEKSRIRFEIPGPPFECEDRCKIGGPPSILITQYLEIRMNQSDM